MVFSRGQGREGHNLGAESVGLDVAVRPGVQYDPFELGGARHGKVIEREIGGGEAAQQVYDTAFIGNCADL